MAGRWEPFDASTGCFLCPSRVRRTSPFPHDTDLWLSPSPPPATEPSADQIQSSQSATPNRLPTPSSTVSWRHLPSPTTSSRRNCPSRAVVATSYSTRPRSHGAVSGNFLSPWRVWGIPIMSFESPSVDERFVPAPTTHRDVEAEHRLAQQSGQLFENQRYSGQ